MSNNSRCLGTKSTKIRQTWRRRQHRESFTTLIPKLPPKQTWSELKFDSRFGYTFGRDKKRGLNYFWRKKLKFELTVKVCEWMVKIGWGRERKILWERSSRREEKSGHKKLKVCEWQPHALGHRSLQSTYSSNEN